MNIRRTAAILLTCFISLLLSTGCGSDNFGAAEESAPSAVYNGNTSISVNKKKLSARHIDSAEFANSIISARSYKAEGLIRAGVVPHHTAGAALISGFFQMAAENADGYDTVVIIAPNHNGDEGDIILSGCDWDVGNGVLCDGEIFGALKTLSIEGVKIAVNDRRMEDDHSASVMVPYINRYLPESKVVPVLVSRTLTLNGIINFAEALTKIINESGKRVLLVCSIDFSHYLSPAEAMDKDIITAEAINANDCKKIYDFSNDNIDSPASLIIFLEYLSKLGIAPEIIDNADASLFVSTGTEGTTSYFVIIGADTVP